MKRLVAIWLPCKLANGVYCLIPLFDGKSSAVDRARRLLQADKVIVGPPCLKKPPAKRALMKLGATEAEALRAEVVKLSWWQVKPETD